MHVFKGTLNYYVITIEQNLDNPFPLFCTCSILLINQTNKRNIVLWNRYFNQDSILMKLTKNLVISCFAIIGRLPMRKKWILKLSHQYGKQSISSGKCLFNSTIIILQHWQRTLLKFLYYWHWRVIPGNIYLLNIYLLTFYLLTIKTPNLLFVHVTKPPSNMVLASLQDWKLFDLCKCFVN